MSLGAVYLKYRIKAYFLLEGCIVSEKRRDNKGRILKTGESQRKDLLYQYRYTDAWGKRRTVYASDLKTLREKEDEITQKRRAGIDYFQGRITLEELLQRYISTKVDIRKSTYSSYKSNISSIRKHPISKRRVNEITFYEAKQWAVDLYNEGKSFGTIKTLRIFIKQAFDMAIEESIVLKNPFDFKLGFIPNNSKTKDALTEEQQKALKDYLKNHPYYYMWYDIIVVLLGTGMRVGEFCGLTLSNLDFENCVIKIDHQIIKGRNNELYIEMPKSRAGTRFIPMTKEVYQSLQNLIKVREESNVTIDGLSGFLLLNKAGNPYYGQALSMNFSVLLKTYNKECGNPPISATLHTFRHTFCSNLIVGGIDPKVVQCVMGHSNVNITLDTYTHISYDYVEKKMGQVFQMPDKPEKSC